jgi:hypothetical protein
MRRAARRPRTGPRPARAMTTIRRDACSFSDGARRRGRRRRGPARRAALARRMQSVPVGTMTASAMTADSMTATATAAAEPAAAVSARRPAFRILITVAAAAGLAWMMFRMPAAAVLVEAVRRLGVTGLLGLVALQAACFAADGAALGLCAPRQRDDAGRRMWRNVHACVVAQAVNTVTPFGQLGELVKARALARDLPGTAPGATVLRHNYVMLAGTLLAVAVGFAVAAAAAPAPLLPQPARAAMAAAAAIGGALAGLTALLLVRGIGRRQRAALARLAARFPRLASRLAPLARIERASRAGAGELPRLSAALGLTLAKRALLVVEAVVILGALGCDHTILLALLSQSNAQIVAWATSFVPGQLGTAEGGTVLLFASLGLPGALGLALELVRRGRRFAVAVLGITLLARR